MNNPFSNIISSELKTLYKSAIDSILEQNGLAVPCTIKYVGAASEIKCNNCIFDPISGLSANIYNGTGPAFFPEGSVCPICMGNGVTGSTLSSSETIPLAIIFDSKHWLNWSSKSLHITDGMVQIICKIEYLPKLRNASELIIDTNISPYGDYVYERANDPEPVGLGDHSYIVSMWTRK